MTIATVKPSAGDVICNIDELPCGRTSFRVAVEGCMKRIDIDKDACNSWITIWNESAQSRYDADADRHTIKVGGRRCCWRLLRLRHVASAEEIEHAQEIIWRNRDLL